MDCLTFLDRLGGLLDGTSTREEREEAERHVAGCVECGELWHAALDHAPSRVPSTPEAGIAGNTDIVDSVLGRTIGSACKRAENLLCDYADGALAANDSAILAAHLGHCAQCGALVGSLREMNGVLAGLAELDPGPAFVPRVLAATSWRQPAPSWLPGRLGEWLQSLVERPRFAFEAAYVGTLLFVLIFGNPANTLQAASERTVAVAQSGIGQVRSALPAALSSLPLGGVEDVQKALPLARVGGDLSAQGGSLAHAADGWWDRAFSAWTSTWTLVRHTVEGVLNDLGARWAEVRQALLAIIGGKAPPPRRTEPQAPPAR
jgi:anti-sigma factor RsiW